MKKLHLAVTAIAVAAALNVPVSLAYVGNDGAAITIEALQDRLLELRDQANNIVARADAENRPMTQDEETEFDAIKGQFLGNANLVGQGERDQNHFHHGTDEHTPFGKK